MKVKTKRLLATIVYGTVITGLYCIIAWLLKCDPAFLMSVGALYFAIQANVEKKDKGDEE